MSVHLIQQGHLLTKTLPLTTLSTHILIKMHAHAHTHQTFQKAVNPTYFGPGFYNSNR